MTVGRERGRRTLVEVRVFWSTCTTFSCEAMSSIVFGRLGAASTTVNRSALEEGS
jgi:hypothetical protein